ncbi:MAG: hypothetical protein M9894_32380 [Planctomycetes bacterium]|nr:hypothetical protein [Planctomycetota bacterium]
MTDDTHCSSAWEALAARLRWALHRRHPAGDPRRDLALFVAGEVARRAARSRGAGVASFALWWPSTPAAAEGDELCLVLAEVRWTDGPRRGRYWLLGQADAAARVVARREGDERRAFQAIELEPALVPLVHEVLDRLQADAEDGPEELRQPA